MRKLSCEVLVSVVERKQLRRWGAKVYSNVCCVATSFANHASIS